LVLDIGCRHYALFVSYFCQTMLRQYSYIDAIGCLVFSIFEENILPFFPVVSHQELADIRFDSENVANNPKTASSLPPIAGLIICTLSALSRKIPRHIFQELSHALYLKFETIEGLRVLSISSLAHIQVLLLLTMNPETQSPATNHSGSMTFLRIGTAIRMAQDLVGTFSIIFRNADSSNILHRVCIDA
jgi:hypothetical protein